MLVNALRTAPEKVVRYLDRQQRRWKFARAMRRFLLALDEPDVSLDLLDELVANWNNTWSAQEEYIQAFLRGARQAQGPILECGSGLSTLLLGAVAERTGQRVWSLEHEPVWLDKVERALARYGINSVTLCLSPLIDYGPYSWYEPPLNQMPGDFALIVCDGPPGTTRGGRYGALPVMKSRCRPGCTILLDDAIRPSEQVVLERWASEVGAPFAIEGETKPYGRVTLGS
jgi:predicted O-methyltransferase YrrM